MEEAQPKLMKAYHFQETLRQFAERCFTRVNEDLPEGDTRQTCVNICPQFDGDVPDALADEMLFVWTDEDGQFRLEFQPCRGRLFGSSNQLQGLAEHLDETPELFEAYMKICFADFDDLDLHCDTPSEEIVYVSRGSGNITAGL